MAEAERARSLVGRWRLVEWRTLDATGTVTGHPFGTRPTGTLIYTAGGWMAGQLAATERPVGAGSDPFGGTEAERAASYSTYVAYTGSYHVEGDRIVHHVTTSLFPAWAGVDQVREFTLSGDALTLRTPRMQVAHQDTVSELRWQREERW